MSFSLIQCDISGAPMQFIEPLPEMVRDNCRLGATLYAQRGFTPPWVGYVAVDGHEAVGGGAFVSAPQDGCVEIAYYTVKELEGRGYATQTATALVDIARKADSGISLIAHTLPQENASTLILRKLGFAFHSITEDPDEGAVWQWRA